MKRSSRTGSTSFASRRPKDAIRHRLARLSARRPLPSLAGSTSSGPHGFLPAQITHAYGIDQIPMVAGQLPGAGQTIALIENSDNPNFLNSADPSFSTSDLAVFDGLTGLPDPPSFTVMSYDADTSTIGPRLPVEAGATGDEFALDVEWAHAIALGASIIIVEPSASGHEAAAKTIYFAASLPGVSVVSSSWASGETPTKPIWINTS